MLGTFIRSHSPCQHIRLTSSRACPDQSSSASPISVALHGVGWSGAADNLQSWCFSAWRGWGIVVARKQKGRTSVNSLRPPDRSPARVPNSFHCLSAILGSFPQAKSIWCPRPGRTPKTEPTDPPRPYRKRVPSALLSAMRGSGNRRQLCQLKAPSRVRTQKPARSVWPTTRVSPGIGG